MVIPTATRQEVLIELARQFDAVRWEEINSAGASEMYDRFVKDPKIGGRLAHFMAPEKVRVWIKDGPAKEYRRALEGKGYLATYTSRAYPGAEAIVRSALGQKWSPRPDSVEEKPMRCFAEDANGQSMYVVWGPMTSLQNLFWNAALIRADDPYEPITIVVTKPNSAPVDRDEWNLTERLANLLDADSKQVMYAVGRKPRVDIAFTPDPG